METQVQVTRETLTCHQGQINPRGIQVHRERRSEDVDLEPSCATFSLEWLSASLNSRRVLVSKRTDFGVSQSQITTLTLPHTYHVILGELVNLYEL